MHGGCPRRERNAIQYTMIKSYFRFIF